MKDNRKLEAVLSKIITLLKGREKEIDRVKLIADILLGNRPMSDRRSGDPAVDKGWFGVVVLTVLQESGFNSESPEYEEIVRELSEL